MKLPPIALAAIILLLLTGGYIKAEDGPRLEITEPEPAPEWILKWPWQPCPSQLPDDMFLYCRKGHK